MFCQWVLREWPTLLWHTLSRRRKIKRNNFSSCTSTKTVCLDDIFLYHLTCIWVQLNRLIVVSWTIVSKDFTELPQYFKFNICFRISLVVRLILCRDNEFCNLNIYNFSQQRRNYFYCVHKGVQDNRSDCVLEISSRF